VLAAPFTEEQLIARVGALLEAAARQGPDERLWERLIAVSDWIPSPIAMLQVYETRQAALAEGHVAMLSAGNIEHACRTTNCKAAPYERIRGTLRARRLIGGPPRQAVRRGGVTGGGPYRFGTGSANCPNREMAVRIAASSFRD